MNPSTDRAGDANLMGRLRTAGFASVVRKRADFYPPLTPIPTLVCTAYHARRAPVAALPANPAHFMTPSIRFSHFFRM